MAGQYKKLMGNTLIFAIGSFASKAMVLLLIPLHTRVLTDSQYGAADLIATASNLITPFIMLSINEAIIRFGMDRAYKKKDVFTVGVTTVLIGFSFFLLLAPFMLKIGMLSSYMWLIYLYVFAAALKNITAQFVRSIGLVKLYATDGFLATANTVLFNILFLVVFKWGSTGYILAIIFPNFISVIFLFVVARLDKKLFPIHINKKLRSEMFSYSIPLIPATMFWWITSASDRFVVTHFSGEAVNGLYAVAHKLPAMLTLVSAVFYQAWQISAVAESGQGRQSNKFYSEVYDYYKTMLFIGASGIIMICIPFTKIVVDEAFYESYRFIPFLTVAEVFSSMITFLGAFYMVSKKNKTVVVAIAIGALINLGLNLLLVPKYGAISAAFATVVAYICAYLIRCADISRLVKIKFKLFSVALSAILLMTQGYLLLKEGLPFPLLIQLGMFVLMILANLFPVLRASDSLIKKRRGNSSPIS